MQYASCFAFMSKLHSFCLMHMEDDVKELGQLALLWTNLRILASIPLCTELVFSELHGFVKLWDLKRARRVKEELVVELMI